ncbi:MAG TPA: hypothetical protein VFU32_06330 [Ktedonobacterales bacterium]|nr:hypothetical protein [Ktedonobacterales bacterium]
MQTIEPTLISLPEQEDVPPSRWRRWASELMVGKGRVSVVVELAMCIFMLAGSSFVYMLPGTDVARYRCYAFAFWMGGSGYPADPTCAFMAHIASAQPFHTLPLEYPVLSLIPFTLTLLAPIQWDQVVFAVCMALLAAGLYWYLARVGPRGAAPAFALYLTIGAFATSASRFDLVPAAFTLFCLVAAVRGRFAKAYLFLAIATMLKLYPLPLLLPLFIAEQRADRGPLFHWRRLKGVGVFAGTCAGLLGVSLLLTVKGALSPLDYFSGRPVQIESLPASIMWLFSFWGFPMCSAFQFGSLNVYDEVNGVCTSKLAPGPMTSVLSPLFLVLMVAGVAWVVWSQWRGKMTVQQAFIGVMLVIIATGKVFSPQYFIWLAPLVAYVMALDVTWLVFWGLLSIGTTAIYPYLYGAKHYITDDPAVPVFYPTIAYRNLLLGLTTLGYIFDIGRLRSRAARTTPFAVSEATEEIRDKALAGQHR